MIIAHISDLHIAAGAPETALLRPDTNARARALVAHLAACLPAIDLVAISGDLCDTGTPADYALLREILSVLPMPFVIIPGNHDRRAPLRAAFADLPFEDATALHYEYRVPGLRMLAVDCIVPGEPRGRLGPRDLAWLGAKLSEETQGATFVVLHHPPCQTRMGMADAAILTEGAEALRALLDGAPNPVTILCGHMHRPFEARFGKTPVHAATSTAFEFDLVPDAATEPGPTDAPYGYQLHFLTTPAGHVVHRVIPAL